LISAHTARNLGQSLSVGFALEEAKLVLGERGYKIFEEIVIATSSLTGWAKFLYHVGGQVTSATSNIASKKQRMKVATMSELRQYYGPGCNCLDPSIDEDLRSVVTSFARHGAWLAITGRLPGLTYTRLMVEVTRPVDYFTNLIKDFLTVLSDVRAGDLNIAGRQFRAIQLGHLKIPDKMTRFIDDENFLDVIGLKKDDFGKCTSVNMNLRCYVGTTERLPANKQLDLVTYSERPVTFKTKNLTPEINPADFAEKVL